MPKISSTIEISAETSRVFHYLEKRYEGLPYRLACVETQEYIPRIVCLKIVENELLEFSIQGREPSMRLSIGAWSWSYQLTRLGDSRTRITIEYQWHWSLGFLAYGVKYQAANALVSDALALQALCSPEESTSVDSPYSSSYETA